MRKALFAGVNFGIGFGFMRGYFVLAEVMKIPFLPCAVVVLEVRLIARSVSGEPRVDLANLNLVKQGQPLTRGLAFVRDDLGGKSLINRRLALSA